MSLYRKVDETNIDDRYYLKGYAAPENMTFKDLLGILRPDFKPSFVTVTEDADRDMKSYGSEISDYDHYLSHYEDTKDGRESLSGTTVAGVYVSVEVIRDDETNHTEIWLSSKDASVELDQIIIEEGKAD